MNISDALDQYRDICGDVLKRYTAKLNKSFKTVFIETLLLYMVIPRKINFTRLGRYGTHFDLFFLQDLSMLFCWLLYTLLLGVVIFFLFYGQAFVVALVFLSILVSLSLCLCSLLLVFVVSVFMVLDVLGVCLMVIVMAVLMLLRCVLFFFVVGFSIVGVILVDFWLIFFA